MALNLSTASKAQGFDVIPPGTLLTLVMKIRAGTIGVEGLCKRSSKGDSEGIDIERGDDRCRVTEQLAGAVDVKRDNGHAHGERIQTDQTLILIA